MIRLKILRWEIILNYLAEPSVINHTVLVRGRKISHRGCNNLTRSGWDALMTERGVRQQRQVTLKGKKGNNIDPPLRASRKNQSLTPRLRVVLSHWICGKLLQWWQQMNTRTTSTFPGWVEKIITITSPLEHTAKFERVLKPLTKKIKHCVSWLMFNIASPFFNLLKYHTYTYLHMIFQN